MKRHKDINKWYFDNEIINELEYIEGELERA